MCCIKRRRGGEETADFFGHRVFFEGVKSEAEAEVEAERDHSQTHKTVSVLFEKQLPDDPYLFFSPFSCSSPSSPLVFFQRENLGSLFSSSELSPLPSLLELRSSLFSCFVILKS